MPQKAGLTYRSLVRIEKIIMMETLGFKDHEICLHVKVGMQGLMRIKRTPEYQRARQEKLSGVISDANEIIKADSDYIKHRLRTAVPQALETLIQAANLHGKVSPQDRRLAVEAAKTILDRDGRFAAVSRIGLPTEAQNPETIQDQQVAKALAEALAAQKAKQTPTIADDPATETVQ